MSNTESINAYRSRCADLLGRLDETNADFEAILRDTQDLLTRAREGFHSDRVNMKVDGGISTLNEAMPAIEKACLDVKLKVNELLYKVCSDADQPDATVNLHLGALRLEDTL